MKFLSSLTAISALVTSMALGAAAISQDWKAALIQRGLAEYCATDGRFAFKGECGNE